MKNVHIKDRADRDIGKAFEYYEIEAGAIVAEKFITETRNALKHIQTLPGSGSPRYGELLQMPLLRSWVITGFPYFFFYFEQEDIVDVVRLLHQQADISAHLQDNIND